MYRFYGDKLAGVSSIHDLSGVVRASAGRDPSFLCLREEDLLGDLPADFDRAAFPDQVEFSNSALPIHYAYKPGQENDGVTLRLSPGQVGAVSVGMLDWLVPGHLEEKILALLRGLPKDIRRRLIPMPEAATRLAREVRPTHPTLAESLAAHLERRDGIRTFPSDWKADELPEHLRVRVEVVDERKRTLVASRDVAQVQALLEERQLEAVRRPEQGVVEAWRRAAAKWEKTGLETWSFDELPDRVLVTESAGLEIHAFPGLRLESDGVALRLFKAPEEARIDFVAALEKFFGFELRYELSWLERDLKDVRKLGPLAVTLAPLEELQRNVRSHLVRRLCRRAPAQLTRTAFAAAAEAARAESKGLLWRLLDQMEVVLKLRQEMLVQMPPYKDAARDLERLVPKDFPANTSENGLKHLPRWLRAMQGRGRKARESAVRDAERAKEIAQVEARFAGVDKAGRLSAEARTELAWMLEELRVSVFAQELGTAFPVSAKRIEKRLAELAP